MQLSIKERLLLLSVIPTEGVRMADLRIAHELQNAVGFTEEEAQRFGFQQDGDQLHWNPEADVSVEIPIGPRGTPPSFLSSGVPRPAWPPRR